MLFYVPERQKKSQMFFSAQISSEDVVETIRANEITKLCAEALRKECEDFDFALEGSLKNPNDLRIAQEKYDKQRPPTWERFFNTIFPYRKSSPNIKRKCDLIFEVVFNIVHHRSAKVTGSYICRLFVEQYHSFLRLTELTTNDGCRFTMKIAWD